jgi:plasmid stabilization system protein ParE
MNARLSGRAQHDLEVLYAYVFATRGVDAADRFLTIVRRAVEFIAQNPYAGPHPTWATRHQTLRFWVVRGTNFLIFYIPDEKEVSIERVLDGRKDVVRILEHGIEEPPEETE